MQGYTLMDLVNRTMVGDEKFYDAKEADARIAELERALNSCLAVLLRHREAADQFHSASWEAIGEAQKALALRAGS